MYHTSSVYRHFLSLLRDRKPQWHYLNTLEFTIQFEAIHLKFPLTKLNISIFEAQISKYGSKAGDIEERADKHVKGDT